MPSPVPPPLPDDPRREARKPFSNAPPADRKFPRPKCGAKLDFDPAARGLKCAHCGYTELIAQGTAETWENDLEETLRRLARKKGASEKRTSDVSCPACGAVVAISEKVATDKCPYCGTHLE